MHRMFRCNPSTQKYLFMRSQVGQHAIKVLNNFVSGMFVLEQQNICGGEEWKALIVQVCCLLSRLRNRTIPFVDPSVSCAPLDHHINAPRL